MTSSRRHFLASVSAAGMTQLLPAEGRAQSGSYGLAYTSFPVRTRQAAAATPGGPGMPAEKFIEHCLAFGGRGGQMDFSQLTSTDAAYLKRIRALLEEKNFFLEFAVSGKVFADPGAYDRVVAAARELGVTRLRTALLGGRRYEDFRDMATWREFVTRWQQTLERAAPMLDKHRLLVGVENHKDWLADEQVALLRRVGSPYLGACVDFGNNMALLEDSVEVAEKLAPFVVTTHLKDMAVRPYERGFELSEVALGDGIVPLARIVAMLRAARSDVHFCLEMITRDPLKVPYRDDSYWVTYERRDPARVEKFEKTILSRAWARPLPTISDLEPARRLAFEDENLRRSAAYAKEKLGLS